MSYKTPGEKTRFLESLGTPESAVKIGSIVLLLTLPVFGYLKAPEFLPGTSPWLGAFIGGVLSLFVIWHACREGRNALVHKYFFRFW